MSKFFQIAAGIFGLIAAALWLKASGMQTAPFVYGYGVVPSPDMPAFQEARRASKLSQWAAGITGLSVLLSSIAQFCPN